VTALALRARLRRRRLLTGPAERARWERLVERRPRALCAIAAATAGVLTWPYGGAVATVAVAVYAWLGAAGLLRHRSARRNVEAVARALDAAATLAADLRAGAAPDGALRAARPAIPSVPGGGSEVDRLGRLVTTAVAVSAATGAPLADLLDRLAAGGSAEARLRQAASAQAAGATATAWLLAALPLAGIGVGYGMGADPLRVLLHTRVGAGCALLALVLQVAGLAWSRRLARTIGTRQ
jgi:tight adherence protein B